MRSGQLALTVAALFAGAAVYSLGLFLPSRAVGLMDGVASRRFAECRATDQKHACSLKQGRVSCSTDHIAIERQSALESLFGLDPLRSHIAGGLAGAGYSSSVERERRTGSAQFSIVSPFMRPNSAVLFVTSLSPRLRA